MCLIRRDVKTQINRWANTEKLDNILSSICHFKNTEHWVSQWGKNWNLSLCKWYKNVLFPITLTFRGVLMSKVVPIPSHYPEFNSAERRMRITQIRNEISVTDGKQQWYEKRVCLMKWREEMESTTFSVLWAGKDEQLFRLVSLKTKKQVLLCKWGKYDILTKTYLDFLLKLYIKKHLCSQFTCVRSFSVLMTYWYTVYFYKFENISTFINARNREARFNGSVSSNTRRPSS